MMHKHRTKKKTHIGGVLSRSVKSMNASPEYVINNLTVGTKAKKNKHFFKSIMQRDSSMTKENIAHQDSRLRQVLILLTGGSCSADLFVHASTGKMKSHEEVSAAVLDLSNSYRMQHGYWGAKTKGVIRFMENKFQKIGALWHVMKVGAAIVALIGGVRVIEKFEKASHKRLETSNPTEGTRKKGSLSTLDDVDSDEDSDDEPNTLLRRKTNKPKPHHAIMDTLNGVYKRGKYGTILAALVGIGAEFSNMKKYNPIRVILEDGTSAITKFRSAQLVNAVFTDGISSENIASMKKVAREITELDHSIERLKVGGIIPLQPIREMITQFQKKEGSIIQSIVGKNCKQKIARLFHHTAHNKVAHSRSSFIRAMIQLCGSQHIYAYYFLNSYGDRRKTVLEIMAAYLIVYKKTKRSLKDFNQRLFPKVASKSSIKDAKYKQKFTTHQSVKTVIGSPHGTSEESASYIERVIHQYKIVIFSKSHCPYCKTVKTIFKKQIKNGTCKIVELDALKGDKGQRIQNELEHKTGQKTIPSVFIDGEHKGGSKEAIMYLAEQNVPFF